MQIWDFYEIKDEAHPQSGTYTLPIMCNIWAVYMVKRYTWHNDSEQNSIIKNYLLPFQPFTIALAHWVIRVDNIERNQKVYNSWVHHLYKRLESMQTHSLDLFSRNLCRQIFLKLILQGNAI